MSDPEKTKMDTKEEINNENNNPQESDYLSSDEEEEDELEEGEFRELVLGIPSKRVAEESLDIVDDQALHEKAIIAAQLFVAAAEEAGATQINPDSNGGSGSGEKTNKKKVGRPRKVRLDDNVMAKAEGSGSIAIGGEGGELPVKKPRKKGSTKLTHPPQGPPRCNICGKGFGSWKAVFGHLRLHKDRGYVGFLPPPMFSMAQEGIGGVVVGSSSGGGGFGLGTGGLDIDLNVEPTEKEEDEGTGSTLKFDLNRSPPQEEEDKEEEA
ncbi:unnamed protein product [Cochlearia groenlandica]